MSSICRNSNRDHDSLGRYRRETLLARFGADMPLPDMLNALADCPRKSNMNDPCGAVYSGSLG